MAMLSLNKTCPRFTALIHSVTHRRYPRVLANSMPKAGTHLLIRLLELADFRESGRSLDIGPGHGIDTITPEHLQDVKESMSQIKPGCFIRSHMYYYPELSDIIKETQVKVVTIVRDPRDVCVSDAFHIAKRPDHRLHSYYATMTEKDRLMASIAGLRSSQLDGGPPSLDIGSHYRHYLGWTRDGAGLVVKFEDLVGKKGGGNDEVQMEAVSRIMEYLGLRLASQKITALCRRLFWTRAKTFRSGQIGSWREHFRPAHIKAFNNVIGTVMDDFYYE